MSRNTLSDRFRRLIGLEAKASLTDPTGFYFDLFGAAPTLAGVSVTRSRR
jgi:hypothetical protein